MRLASKKIATSFFGKLIKLWTFSRYCHSELVFSDGEWFSSREFKGAVSFSQGVPKGEDESMYDFIDLPISPEDEMRIKKWCCRELLNDEGKPCGYDVRGVLFSFLPIPIGWQSTQDWFCSEICTAALQSIGWLAGYTAASVSPKQLPVLIQKEIDKRLAG